jgi:ADP-heptose:LPS heptosyltransferase
LSRKTLKSIELFIKNSLKSIIFKKKSRVSPQVVAEPSPNILNCNKILLLRPDRIGDVLVSIPFFRNLSEHLKDKNVKIDILLSSKNIVIKPAIQEYFNEIYCLPRNLLSVVRLIKKLKQKKYDLIIDLLDNPSFTSSLIIKAIKPRYSLGFDKENRNVYTHIVPLPDKSKVHIVERICHLLHPFGIVAEENSKSLFFQAPDDELLPLKKKKRIGINLSGSSPEKFWGIQNFKKLIEYINDRFDFEIVVFATGKYKEISKELNNFKNVYFAPFQNDFIKFASMVKSCDVLITPDTSTVHIASAFQIPVVALYTYQDPKFGMPWFPYKTKSITLISKHNFYSDISPEDVLNGLIKLLES